PLRQPELATVCLTATIGASFALVRRLRRGNSLTGPLLVCVGAIAGLLVDRARNPGLRPYFLNGRWMTEFFGLLPGVPFLGVGVALSRETFQARFDRASGISGPRLDDAARLVRYLGDAATPRGDLLVLVDQPMLYFLAGRRSALSGDEYVFYVVGAGYMADQVARRLVDEQDAIRDLARTRPVVVDRRGSVESTRFRRTFPSIARFIDDTYRPA